LGKHLCIDQNVQHHLSTKTLQKVSEYEKSNVNSRLRCFKRHASSQKQSFAEELSHSLSHESKFISPKFFYDKTGSELFEKICDLPEYYLARTEIEILNRLKTELANFLDDDFRLVELGSGSSKKTRHILDVLHETQSKTEYFPIDISDILEASSQELLSLYQNLHITGIIDTYENGLEFLNKYDLKNNLIVFLGSSFGNFDPKDGLEFLKKINSIMKDSDLFLIGLDLIKEKSILEKAYDDSEGVTRQFNLNILSRINTELDGNFDLANFAHVARYNENEKRIEMYLQSLTNQTVQIPKANLSITLQKDELIHTENSYKFSLNDIEDMMADTGFEIKRIWFDSNKHYAMVLASKI